MSDILVFLRCPSCHHEWHAGTIRPGSWWGHGTKPETLAKTCYCPKCECQPPMDLRDEEVQPSLFVEEAR